MISELQVRLTNLDSIFTSYRPLIFAATQLLKREPSFSGVSAFDRCTRRSILPFLGDALSWLMGTTTTKDVSSMKKRVQPTDCNTTQTTRNSSSYHLCFKHHKICHSDEQATYQPSDGCSRKDTPGLQHSTTTPAHCTKA